MEENPSLETNSHTANQLINAPTYPPFIEPELLQR
jgi:hypothetical protein